VVEYVNIPIDKCAQTNEADLFVACDGVVDHVGRGLALAPGGGGDHDDADVAECVFAEAANSTESDGLHVVFVTCLYIYKVFGVG
jgi:hypothetical protein